MSKNLIGLMDACCDAVENPSFQPKPDGTTYCNMALSAIAIKAFGNHDFDGKTADEIAGFVAASDQYTLIPMEQAQELANQGSLVFAIASSQDLKQSHGHVCIVRPGIEKDSGKWGPCPSVVNIGAEVFIARAKRGPLQGLPAGVNEAFQPKPDFYVWRGSI